MGEWTGGNMPECPAISELKQSLKMAVPHIWIGRTTDTDGSRHQAGLAIDVMLHSKSPDQKQVADGIIDALVDEHAQMGWFDLIYTDWNGGRPSYFHIPGLPPFGGPNGMLKKNPAGVALGHQHENHFHVDWWPGGHPTAWPATAKNTGFKTALIIDIHANTQPSAAQDLFSPRELFGWWVVTTSRGTWRYRFNPEGTVDWAEPETPRKIESTGTWRMDGTTLKLTWSASVEPWDTPFSPPNQAKGVVNRTAGETFPLAAKKA